jgi:hypothetical protein
MCECGTSGYTKFETLENGKAEQYVLTHRTLRDLHSLQDLETFGCIVQYSKVFILNGRFEGLFGH